MSTLYPRKYRLSIATWRGATLEIDPNIHMIFRVEKRINDYLWIAEVTLLNLSSATETDILENGRSITLEAGYETGPYGQIFQGSIRQPIRGKEDGTTFFLRLVCMNDMLDLGYCNLALSDGQTYEDMIRAIARSSTVPFDIRINGNLGGQVTERGKTIAGKPADEIRSIAINNNGFLYTDDDGVVNVSTLSQGPPAIIPDLNAETGLIGIPSQVDFGVKIRTLIRPDIRLDSWVKLNNKDVIPQQIDIFDLPYFLDLDGIYRVIEIIVTGDTRGNDWYFDIEAINQTGALPEMLAVPSAAGI